jgi:creatinine amidohydrolase
LPGTIGLTVPVFKAINEEVAEQTIKNGFKNVVLMGDHGGGQSALRDLAKTLSQSTPRRECAWSIVTTSI